MVIDHREWTARFALFLVVIGLPLTIYGIQLRSGWSYTRVVNIHMRNPDEGGFSQDVVYVNTGETVTLRFRADDVTHGIAIGPGSGVDLGAIDPGEVGEVTLTFDHAGTYTYYCTTYCSPDHWRMRGVIQVRDAHQPDLIPTTQVDPIIASLQAEGVNIDEARILFAPVQGMRLSQPEDLDTWAIPAELQDSNWYISHTPARASELLFLANPEQAPEAVYGATAMLWRDFVTQTVIDAQYLYNQNCAACHGQTGLGDGPAAFFTPVQPVAFANTAYMFNMRPDVLYAKIRRGGMGTNMPNFGTIFTPEESWALVNYLWELAFRIP